MTRNPVRFAVVREDPLLESSLVGKSPCRVLLVASGGCTALSLLALHQDIHVTAFDINPAQLDLVKRKRLALQSGDSFAEMQALCQSGEFESLFRSLRSFLLEFVTDESTLLALCSPLTPSRREELAQRVCTHPYWTTAFQLFFSNALLNTMFGPAATQHAPPHSYPGYFARLFEAALRDASTQNNPFMHHILVGKYRRDALPPYLAQPLGLGELTLVQGPLSAVAPGPFDVISLSNLLDWMTVDEQTQLAQDAQQRLAPGGQMVLRQLNNTAPVEDLFPSVNWDDGLSRRWVASERSRFYARILVGQRRP